MVRWLSKLALYLVGLILLLGRPVDALAVACLLAALTAGCLSGVFRARWTALPYAVLWAVATWFFPFFGLFWPLVVFDTLEKRLWPLLLLAAFSLLAAAGGYTAVELALTLLFCALAALLWFLQGRLEVLARERRIALDEAREQGRRLAEKSGELIEAREDSAKLATLAERSRIAREIHDNVGHMLARSMMQTGAVMTLNADPAVGEGLAQLKETLTLAMNSVRESVHDLRDESFDLYETVRASLQDFAAYETNLNYDMGEAPQDVKACFAAVVREGLANIARHSNATRIQVSLQEHPRFYQLGIADNGSPTAGGGGQGFGMGLENMRQRAEALGGRLTVRRENGFAVHLTIPREPPGPSPAMKEGREHDPDPR